MFGYAHNFSPAMYYVSSCCIVACWLQAGKFGAPVRHIRRTARACSDIHAGTFAHGHDHSSCTTLIITPQSRSPPHSVHKQSFPLHTVLNPKHDMHQTVVRRQANGGAWTAWHVHTTRTCCAHCSILRGCARPYATSGILRCCRGSTRRRHLRQQLS
jgi:hypothetical protein